MQKTHQATHKNARPWLNINLDSAYEGQNRNTVMFLVTTRKMGLKKNHIFDI